MTERARVDDATYRQRGVDDVNRVLYELHDAGCLPHFTHRTEQGRQDPTTTVDVWELTFMRPDGTPEERSWTYTYAAVRALIRGWRLGKRYG